MENEVLYLIYGCNTSVMPLRPYNLFSCNSSGDNFNNAFYLIGPVPNDPILRIIYCNVSISVPILRAAGDRLNGLNISLEEALMQGFSVNYSDPYESNCSECSRFGGQCGFDSGLSQPVCICGDRPCPFALTPPRNDSVPSKDLVVNAGFDSGLGQPVCICGYRTCPFALTPPRNDSVPSQGEYATCGAPYRCGDIQNITYPFWGGSRPEYCGFSGFQLNCQGGVALLNILSIQYRVLEINNTTWSPWTLKVAREDLRTTACPRFLYNTTLDLNLFKPSPDYSNVTIYYGCSLNGQPTQLVNQFSCNVNGTNTDSFYVIEDSSASRNTIRCNNSIYVPINRTYQSLFALPTASVTRLLQDAFVSGFSLRWEANNRICQNCVGSGGLCGTNRDGSFACYCANRTSALTCNDAPTGNGT
ncbi:unnamed protein product [Fraxinus pennsylvanica]|uniref:non-specific serine/threonine protein kinase n=1 Tax=Fraxinus pennsylvanica TaxID=56036 RepID=A0AAD1YWH3_9LAMI|nr:unnamed protein product [Fraxinus pennsylvanica]